MNKKPLIFRLLVACLAIMLMYSCSKEGPAGPAGAAGNNGTNGTNGTPGTPGATGPKGDPGTANVIYSAWLDVAFLPDTVHAAGGRIDTLGYYSGINVPKLTLALLSNADVKVYVNLNTVDDPVIAPLPYVEESGVNIRFIAYTASIQFSSNIDGSTYLKSGKKYLQYRYVIIPGGVGARQSVDWNNYAAVKAYLGLKD
ncbi:hypothetical protein ACE38W_13630 [Chitinophaga sp. Hz27]|uniref:hypothetical protein n=1 Tax=Chitinophaga sp. Hz27 TaxID=3347169 RepID=UPI0035DBD6DD